MARRELGVSLTHVMVWREGERDEWGDEVMMMMAMMGWVGGGWMVRLIDQ